METGADVNCEEEKPEYVNCISISLCGSEDNAEIGKNKAAKKEFN